MAGTKAGGSSAAASSNERPMNKKHTHKFTAPYMDKVLLSSGSKTAVDTIRGFQCVCGLKQAEDIAERNAA